jgi:hypothetical protein
MRVKNMTRANFEALTELVSLVEWLAWADGLVERDEALRIKAHRGLWTGKIVWDVSELPEQKREPVLQMIYQIESGRHPALVNPGSYQPARVGEPDPGLPRIKTELNFGPIPGKEDE